MAIQLKIQVLDISAMEKRTYQGRTWFERQFQCFVERKVAVHTLNAPSDDSEESKQAREKLNAYEAGYYMADIVPVQGDRAKLEFRLSNLVPVAQQPTAKT